MTKFSILLISLIFLLVSCKYQDSDKPLAEFKSGKILFADFENEMLEYKFKTDFEKAAECSMDERREFLRNMIYRNIIFDLAKQNKLDTIKTLKEEFSKKLYSQAIMNGFVVDSIRNKIYNEDDIKTAYEQRKIKYLPKHILIDVKKHKEKPAKAKIDSIYKKINNGEKFEDLAKKYSDDVQTGANGGELGWVFAYDMVKEFEDNVLKMKVGEYSEPFLSEYGYHIIYLSDAKKNDALKSYENEKRAIMKDFDKKYSVQFNDIYLRIIDDLMQKYNVTIDSANIKHFIKQNKKYTEQVKNEEKAEPLDLFTEIEKKMIFSKFDDDIIDANKLISELKVFPKDKRPEIKGYDDIKMYVVSKFRNKFLENYADDLGYTKKKEYIENAKINMFDSYKEKLINLFVRSKVSDPSIEELQKYYNDNKEIFEEEDGNYKEFNKVKVSISNSIKGKKYSQGLKEWEKEIFQQYGLKINYSLLENTFYRVKDDKK